MTDIEISRQANENQQKALKVLDESGIARLWQEHGCRVNLVGSLRMGLFAAHKDIDLHVYSHDITEESSFAIAAAMARLPGVKELKCINGLHTDECCIAWHVLYIHDGEQWQFDIIHIEHGSRFDGYFERMADRIATVMTPQQKAAILRLKFETPPEKDYHGVEYYEAVIADGINNMPAFDLWVAAHRKLPARYWIP